MYRSPRTTAVDFEKKRYLLVSIDHATGLPVFKLIERITAEEVRLFMKNEIIYPFGAQKTVVSDNTMCFTVRSLRGFMESHGTEWRTVLAYAPMSNRKAKRIVGTIKRAVRRLVSGTRKE